MKPLVAVLALTTLCLSLLGCDQQRITNLSVGEASEADVRQQFGEPQATYAESDGAKTFEYSRQPEGQVAYMITLEPDGKLRKIRQVLTPDYFAKVVPGMPQAEVRRLLGRPAKTSQYALKPDEQHWEWRWLSGQAPKVFTVTFDPQGVVVSTAVSDDPRAVTQH